MEFLRGLTLSFLLIVMMLFIAHAQPLVPALLIFGDSVVDCGNNNNRLTLVKANFPPYGRDFITHKPTGRFCNGKLATDYTGKIISHLLLDLFFFSISMHMSADDTFLCTADYLGFTSYPPAYLSDDAKGRNILIGANFASGAAGYYNMTSATYVI